MYFAINRDDQNIEPYFAFLNQIKTSSKESKYYVQLFKEIIRQTQNLLSTKNYYDVSSERFAIVKYFSQFPEIVSQMDAENLDSHDFETLMSCFHKLHSTAV